MDTFESHPFLPAVGGTENGENPPPKGKKHQRAHTTKPQCFLNLKISGQVRDYEIGSHLATF